MDKQRQRVVLVTGGTSGIGYACVRKFHLAGDIVVTCARHPPSLDLFAADRLDPCSAENQPSTSRSEVVFHQSDVGVTGVMRILVDRVVDRHDRIDVLINNAAFVPRKPIDQLDKDDLDQSFRVNLQAVAESARAVMPHFQKQGSGVLINMSSMAAIDPFPGFSIYGACKAWIESFTYSLDQEFRATPECYRSCFAYAIRAGAVDTPLLRRVLPEFPLMNALSAEKVADRIHDISLANDRHLSGTAIEIGAE